MAEQTAPPLPEPRPTTAITPKPRPAPDLTVEDWARYYATIPTRAGLSLLNGLYKTSGSMAALLGLVDQKDVDAYYDSNIRSMKALEDKITSTRGAAFIAENTLIPQEVYGIIGEMASFAVPYLGLSKILTGGQILKPLAATVATDLFIGFGGLSPNDENLFNLLADLAPDSETAVAIESYLGTDPDDPEIVNRTRNAVEALLALGAAEGVIRAIIAVPEFLRKLKRTKDALPAEYVKAVEAIDDLPPGKSTDRLKAAIDPEGKPTAQQADPTSPYSSPEEAAEGPNNQDILAQQNEGETVSSVPVSTVTKLADAKTDEELIGAFVEGDGIVTPKPKNIEEDEGLVPFDEDLTPEQALLKQTQQHPALGAAKLNFDQFEYFAKKPGGSSPGGIYKFKDTHQKVLIKMYDDPDQVVNEIIANRFYNELGIPVPLMQMVRDGDRLYLSSPFIENLQPKTDFFGVSTTGINQLGQIYPAAAFIQDNDVVGIDMSNIQFTKQSYTTKKLFGALPIDHGGAFFFKAMGDKKGYTGDADALDSFLDGKYDPAKLFNVPEKDLVSFSIGAENTLNNIELLNIDTFIDNMQAAGLTFKNPTTMDYLKKTMKEKQKAFAEKAPQLFKEKLNQTYQPPGSSVVTQQDLDDLALDPDVPIDIVKKEDTGFSELTSDDAIIKPQVSPNKKIKKLLNSAEKIGYNSGFLLIRNDTFGKGLFQLDPPPVTAKVPETALGKQLGRKVLPEGATLTEAPEGSVTYAGSIYTVPFVNKNGFYKNKDGTSEFSILDFKKGNIGFSNELGATTKSLLQVGKSLAMDNPQTLFDIDLPDSVDILELLQVRADLIESAEQIFPNNPITRDVIDYVLTNSYGAAPTGIVRSIFKSITGGLIDEGDVLEVTAKAHEKLTAAIKKDSDFQYPRMDYSGLHPQGFNQYNDTYSAKYAKFFGRPWESQSTGYRAGKANISNISGSDWADLESNLRSSVDEVLSYMNKDATSIKDAYVSIPVIDEANSAYYTHTKSQSYTFINDRFVTGYTDEYYENFYKYISDGVKKHEKLKDINIPLQSVALLGQDRLAFVLPYHLDFDGTITKSVVLDPEAASKMPKGSLPAPIDVPNSARMEQVDKDILSTPGIATAGAAALTATQFLEEPEEDMNRQMQELVSPREQVGPQVPGLRTRYGRPVYETDEGEVSEQSVTLQTAPDEFINIPSIHGGVQYDRNELRDMYQRGEIQATSRHADVESAVAEAETRSNEMFRGVPFEADTVDDPFDLERTDMFAGQTEELPTDDTSLRIEVTPRPAFEQTDELFNQQRGMI